MSVRIMLHCSGCNRDPVPGGVVRQEFVSFSGRSYGFGNAQTRVELDVPDGWVAFDPYTYATYCPECWASIQAPEPKIGGVK